MSDRKISLFSASILLLISRIGLSQAVPTTYVPYPPTGVQPYANVAGPVNAQFVDAGNSWVQGQEQAGLVDAGALMVANASTLHLTSIFGNLDIDGGAGPGLIFETGVAAFSTNAAIPYLETDSSGDMVLNVPTGETGYIGVAGLGTINMTWSASGVTVGAGAVSAGYLHGTCTLSSGLCNAVVTGSDGSTHCIASSDEASQTAVGCNVKADGGSASVSCLAATTGVASVWCWR